MRQQFQDYRDYEDSVANGDDLSASRTYALIDARGYSLVDFVLDIGASAGRAGDFSIVIEGQTLSGSNVTVDDTKLVVHGNGNSLTIGATATELHIMFSNPAAKVGLVYSSTTAGSAGAGQLNAEVNLFYPGG